MSLGSPPAVGRAVRRPEWRRAALLALLTAVAVAGAAASRPAGSTDVPVLLVPGWLDTERDLAALRIRFLAAGWEPEAVQAVTFADPTGSNVDHAMEIAGAVASLREATGAEVVDIIAHSMGGLATRLFLKQGGRARRVVFVASPHQGTWLAYLAWGDGSEEMRPGSAFLEVLNAPPLLPEAVEALTIRTAIDTHIIPAESGKLPPHPDREVCCPTHAGLLRDIEVFRIIRRFLGEGDPGVPPVAR